MRADRWAGRIVAPAHASSVISCMSSSCTSAGGAQHGDPDGEETHHHMGGYSVRVIEEALLRVMKLLRTPALANRPGDFPVQHQTFGTAQVFLQ